jgi:hypothetical protein
MRSWMSATSSLESVVMIQRFPAAMSVNGPSDYFSSSRTGGFSLSIRSACSASAIQPAATSSNAFFIDGFLACAARSLASAALCRYLSARSDI